jgi:hypothetical protein
VPEGPARDAIVARFARHAHGYAETLPDRRELQVRVDGRVASMEYAGEVGRADLETGVIDCPGSPVLCDALVRVAASWKLAQRGALFLHSSAVRVTTPYGVMAVVFFGKSGVGKSTLATTHGDFISDELSLIESSDSSGVDRSALRADAPSWTVAPTPWWHGSGDPAPLKQLVWLVRGERPSVRRVGGGELLRALLQETGRYLPIAEFQSRVFDLCARLAASGAVRVAAGEGRVVQDVFSALAEHMDGASALRAARSTEEKAA